MKRRFTALGFLCALCLSAVNCLGLDREAFSITKTDLTLQIETEQHRLGARGKLTLRNDTALPQKVAVLQISSSLSWRSIKIAPTEASSTKATDQMVQFMTQPFVSDIDHTGSLSEAIVTLPQTVAPKGTVELEVAYEGVVLLDATRLARIGTPEEIADSTDWDQIDAKFTGLRGAGYVAWYPIATEVADISEGNSWAEVLARWKAREAGSEMHLKPTISSWDSSPEVLFNGVRCELINSGHMQMGMDCTPQPLRLDTPTLIIASYQVTMRPSIEVMSLPGHEVATVNFADSAEKAMPLITDWFGPQRERAKTADLPDPHAAPFETGALLLTPLTSDDSTKAGLAAVHQLTHAAFLSFRPWIEEGLAHFAQALYLEQQKGRQAAIDYMGVHRSFTAPAEPADTPPRSEDEATRSLVNTNSEALYRGKAMCVWWMLRDMLGEAALKKALAAYRPEQDKDPTYMPRLLAAQSQRDLAWFFDDWVYHDRGLPDFKVESAFARKMTSGSFLLTITLDNLGSAGAEVPVVVKFSGGEVMRRMEVRAKDKTVVRVELQGTPLEIVVNDGSVPEKNTANNRFKVEVAAN